jgi:hypothetical protein
MMRVRSLWAILAICILSPLMASDFVIEESLQLITGTSEYKLNHPNIVNFSESVQSDTLLLVKDVDYTINYKTGSLKLLRPIQTTRLLISYLVIPPELSAKRQTYRRIVLTDTLAVLPGPNGSDWFAQSSNLIISGSKTFSLSFSESGETDLLQSLYVNLSGELAPNVQITAQLSDSQSKLSPEGDSKELSSLDQVFIRVNGKRWELGMGDLELHYASSRYLNYFTKLEGIAASYTGNNEFSAAFSAASGKSTAMTIIIIDGKQGPYYLSPNSTQRSFIVVAGTEQIYLDGQLLERGTDYYIDYSEGSVMFRRMVSSLNSVNAIFQYSDENYRQSSYYSNSRLMLSERLSLSHHLVHQADSKKHPLLFNFSPQDLDSLALAGDNPVYTDGVVITEPGSGNYTLLTDTLGNPYYEYAPGDSTAIYNVAFSYVGPGSGDYEQFSIGRYRYVGIQQGAWHPVKIIVAPALRSNLELSLAYTGELLHSGIDALYSYNDMNTLSSRDDEDNAAGIVSAWLAYKQEGKPLTARLDATRRFADTYRFGSDGAPEHDFAALADTDSLAMSNLDLNLSYLGSFIKPELLVRYKDWDDRYTQKALRFTSQNQNHGWIPYLRLSNTVSLQEGTVNSLLMYHSADLGWQYRLLELRMAALYSGLENDDPAIGGTRLIRWQPGLDLKTQGQITSISYTADDTSVKLEDWQRLNSQQTYAIRHSSNFENHRMDLDFSHRVLNNPLSETQPKSNYDLFNYRSGHSILKGAFSLYANYQLNQTEFYPRIRELVWVGTAQGIYDSTGVMIDSGEYIYEYITSPTGSLSTELSGNASIYLKPGQYFSSPIWQRLHSDLSLSANEQTDQANKWQSYIFLPDYSYNSDSIYARRSWLQNFWLDIYKSRIIGNLSLEHNRNLDQRYQIQERGKDSRQNLQVDFRNFYGLNTRFSLGQENQQESRYSSEISIVRGSVLVEKVLNPQSTLQIESGASSEDGKQQGADSSYQIRNIYLSPSLRSVFMQKYRISARANLGYNFRAGDDYLLFLPQKREGMLGDATLSAIYRINDFSSVSMEYRFGKYPQDNGTHNLKLEFKAEL